MSNERIQTSIIHIPPCSQKIIKNLIFFRFYEDGKWGCSVAKVTISCKVVLSVHILYFLRKSSISLICNYIMNFILRNLSSKNANLVIWKLKLNGFHDEIVTIATNVNTCVLLLFSWIFKMQHMNHIDSKFTTINGSPTAWFLGGAILNC